MYLKGLAPNCLTPQPYLLVKDPQHLLRFFIWTLFKTNKISELAHPFLRGLGHGKEAHLMNMNNKGQIHKLFRQQKIVPLPRSKARMEENQVEITHLATRPKTCEAVSRDAFLVEKIGLCRVRMFIERSI